MTRCVVRSFSSPPDDFVDVRERGVVGRRNLRERATAYGPCGSFNCRNRNDVDVPAVSSRSSAARSESAASRAISPTALSVAAGAILSSNTLKPWLMPESLRSANVDTTAAVA